MKNKLLKRVLFIFILIFICISFLYFIQYKRTSNQIANLTEINSLFSIESNTIDNQEDMANILYKLNLLEEDALFTNDESTPLFSAKSNIIKIIIIRNYSTDNFTEKLYINKSKNIINAAEGPSIVYPLDKSDQKNQILSTDLMGILIPKYIKIDTSNQFIDPVRFIVKENDQVLIISYIVYQQKNQKFIPIGYMDIGIYYNH